MTEIVDTPLSGRAGLVAPRGRVTSWAVAPGRINSSLRSKIPNGLLNGGRVLKALAIVGILVGVVLRMWTSSQLWLDEAISVNIAKLGLGAIPSALRIDGAPPLYYYLLHLWMLVFGSGDVAVRSLSGLMAVASLPLFWLVGRRFGGTRLAWAVLIVAATSPFAISYATSARMYSMMMLLAVAGVWFVLRALERPTPTRLVPVGVITAALLYTHYWSLYLVMVVVVWLARRVWGHSGTLRGPRHFGTLVKLVRGQRTHDPDQRRAGLSVLVAVVAGGVAWLPWLPTFVYQTLHTGTPWTGAAGPADLLHIFNDYATGAYVGGGPWASVLILIFFASTVLGLFGWTNSSGGISIGTVVRRRARPVLGILLGTLVVAVGAGAVAQAAFVARYTAVVYPLFVVIVAFGVTLFDRRIAAAILGVISVAGLLVAIDSNGHSRTQAASLASVLSADARPGDLVLYCPDQLGPAVSRLFDPPDVTQLTFPRAYEPYRVDWVDYKKVIAASNVEAFADQMLALAGHGTIWFVWRQGYPSFGSDCGQLYNWFDSARGTGTEIAGPNPANYEYAELDRFSL